MNNRYKTNPGLEQYAFSGYGVTFFIMKMLDNFGRNFNNCIESDMDYGPNNRFVIKKKDGGGYENTTVSVYELKDYKRKLVSR